MVKTGWGITILVTLLMLLDAVGKIARPKAVLDGFAHSGWPVELSLPLGVVLLVCTVLYVVPRTTILGAVLLTGYLGGAVATNLRLENPLWSSTLSAVYFGVFVWAGVWLRDAKLRSIFPWVRS